MLELWDYQKQGIYGPKKVPASAGRRSICTIVFSLWEAVEVRERQNFPKPRGPASIQLFRKSIAQRLPELLNGWRMLESWWMRVAVTGHSSYIQKAGSSCFTLYGHLQFKTFTSRDWIGGSTIKSVYCFRREPIGQLPTASLSSSRESVGTFTYPHMYTELKINL